MELKLRQHNNDENPIVIKKKNLIPIGLIFCTCNNIEKIKLFFDLFKNDKDEFCKSEELNDFLLSDFLTASYCLISARNKIGKNNENVQEMKKEDLVKLINCAELKDNENCFIFLSDKYEVVSNYKINYNISDRERGNESKEEPDQWGGTADGTSEPVHVHYWNKTILE